MGDAGAQGLLFARFTWEGPGVAGALVRSPWGGRGGAWLLVRLVCAGRIKLLGYEKLLQLPAAAPTESFGFAQMLLT